MKIGILTFHAGINYGAFLQAYALQRTLESLHHTVYIIDYHPLQQRWREYRAQLPVRAPRTAWHNLQKIAVMRRELQHLNLTAPVSSIGTVSENFDMIVIGSDEVWNLNNPIVGGDLSYFGKALHATSHISYAASFNQVSLNMDVKNEVVELLDAFQYISVRDPHSAKLIERWLKTSVPVVVDPVWLYDFADELVSPQEEQPYILIYAYNVSEACRKAVQLYAERIGANIISAGYYQSWADKNLPQASLFEWIGYIQQATCVITNTFHGTLFSIKYNRPFVMQMNPTKYNKLHPLLEKLHLTDRIINRDTNSATIQSVIGQPIDYVPVRAIVESLVTESLNYLHDALA